MYFLSRFSFSCRTPQLFLLRHFSSNQNVSSKFNNFVNSTNFIIDKNVNVKREKLMEKEVAEKVLIFEKATAEDVPIIVDFYSTYFNINEVLTATLKMTNEEAREVFTVIANEMETYMLRDRNKFIGMMSSKKIEAKEYPVEKTHIAEVKDYGKLIDSGPYQHRTINLIHVLLEACEAKIYEHMKFPCRYYHIALGGIHPKYFAQNLGTLMSLAALKYWKEQGVKYSIGVCTSDASLKLHLKIPDITVVHKYPYKNFLDHGRKPFENVIGGNQFAYPFYVDVEKC